MTEDPTARIYEYLDWIHDHDATDLLIMVDTPPMARIDGKLIAIPNESVLDAKDVEELVLGVLEPAQAESYLAEKEVDFSFNWSGVARFRGNAFFQRGTMAVALRRIPLDIPTFNELGLPKAAEELVHLPQGLILITGPTGSGKSTTLASMIDRINNERRCHILTIEDPIEYVHQNAISAVTQREVGEDTNSFERGLRSALREDPDVLLLGEMRDLESIQTAMTIAETGHLVFATLHTNDTAQAIDRVIDVFPAEKQQQIRIQLAGCLQAVIFQRLIPKVNGGMVAAYEVLLANFAVRNLIKSGKTSQIRNAITTHQEEGMQTFEMALNGLVANGQITYDEAKAWSLLPDEIVRPVKVS
jgi:twitching motility protein PilT